MEGTKQAGATSAGASVPKALRDKESIRMLVLDVGYQEASKQLGIKYATLRQWAKRGKWNQPLTHSQAVTTVTRSPGDALREVLEKHSSRAKTALAIAGTKAAEHLADAPAEKVLKLSRNMRDVTASLSQVHQWESNSNAAGPIQFNVLAQRAYFGKTGDNT